MRVVIIEEVELTSSKLIKEIDEILENKKKYDIMKKESSKLGVTDSASKIYREIRQLIDGV